MTDCVLDPQHIPRQRSKTECAMNLVFSKKNSRIPCCIQQVTDSRNIKGCIYICTQESSDMSNLVLLRKLSEKHTTQGFLCLPRQDTRTSSNARYSGFLNKIPLQSLRYQVFPSKSLRGKAFWAPAMQSSSARYHIEVSISYSTNSWQHMTMQGSDPQQLARRHKVSLDTSLLQ